MRRWIWVSLSIASIASLVRYAVHTVRMAGVSEARAFLESIPHVKVLGTYYNEDVVAEDIGALIQIKGRTTTGVIEHLSW